MFYFLDESKNVRFCGPREIVYCVTPADGKLQSSFVILVLILLHSRSRLNESCNNLID